jgi:DNA-binding transcriptional regulator WhiA
MIKSSPEVVEKMKNMYANGFTLKQIALSLTGKENDRKQVSKILKSNGVNVSYFTYTCNHNFFESINTEKKAYWLGFIYADGYILTDDYYKTGKLGIALGITDKEHLEEFKKDINSNHPIKVYTNKTKFSNKTTYCRIVVTSKKLVDDLIKCGVLPSKTEKLVFPDSSIVNENLINHFIRGYMDGDGSIIEPKNKKYQLTFCGTKEFISGIQDKLGIDLKIRKRHDNDVNNWTLAITGNYQVEKLLDYIYKDSTIYLKRKYERYINLKNLNNK